jgi:hypothetical protein
MATKLMQIGDQRRPQLGTIGVYRTKESVQYSISHPYIKSLDEGPLDTHGKSPISPNDSDNYGKVGDYNDINARIGINSPGALQKNKYFRLGNQYDAGDVVYP